jgi:hypothetical protein
MARSTLGERDWEPPPIGAGVKVAYRGVIEGLLGWKAKTPVVFKLTPGAYGLWVESARGFEKQLGEGGELSSPGAQEWAGKLPGALARVALLLTCVQPGRRKYGEVREGAMREALSLGEYLVPHARAAFKALRTDPATEGALTLQKWIVNGAANGRVRFTRSNAQQNHKNRFPNVSDIDGPLRILTDRQVCRPLPVEPRGPGQPPAWYEVNPALGPNP